MRVLHVIATGRRGGGFTHLLGVLPELAKLGLQPSVAVGDDGPLAAELEARGIPTDILNLPGPRPDPRGVIRVSRLLARRAPDVVHYHATRAGIFGALRRLAGGPPAVYTAHGLAYRLTGPARPAFFVSEAIICRAVDQVLSVARADLADLERRRFLPRGRGLHVPNAVDARFRPREAAAARLRLGLPPDARVIGTVTRLEAEKSVTDFVDAALRLPADVHSVVVGEGPERGDLERRAAPLGGRVHFLGARDDVEEILPAFDVFLLSSLREGEPIALLEAMAAGIACVATDTTGSRELLERGAGLLAACADPEALAAATARLLGDAAERGRLVEAGRRVVAERTYAKLAAQLASVYAALPGRGASV